MHGLSSDFIALVERNGGVFEREPERGRLIGAVLSGPRVDDSVLLQLRRCCSLRALSLVDVSATAFSLRGLTACPLERLVLAGEFVDSEWLAAISSFPELQDLTLWRGAIDDVAVQERFPLLPQLIKLDLTGCKVGDETVRRIAECNTVQHLSLSGTRVADRGLKPLTELPALRALELNDTVLSDACWQHIGDMIRLERLAIDDTRVTGKGIDRLWTLEWLTDISIDGTPFAEQYIDDLIKCPMLTRVSLQRTALSPRALASVHLHLLLRPIRKSFDEFTRRGGSVSLSIGESSLTVAVCYRNRLADAVVIDALRALGALLRREAVCLSLNLDGMAEDMVGVLRAYLSGRLVALELSGTVASDVLATLVDGSKRLRSLTIAVPLIEKGTEPLLYRMRRLERLAVFGGELSDEIVNVVLEMTWLRCVDIRGSNVNVAARKMLQRAFGHRMLE